MLLAISFALPEHFPQGAVPAAYTMTLRALTQQVQAPAIVAHLTRGGQKQSKWRVLIIGGGSLALILLLAYAGLSLLLPEEPTDGVSS